MARGKRDGGAKGGPWAWGGPWGLLDWGAPMSGSELWVPQAAHRAGGRFQVPRAGGGAAGQELDGAGGERGAGQKPAEGVQECGDGE